MPEGQPRRDRINADGMPAALSHTQHPIARSSTCYTQPASRELRIASERLRALSVAIALESSCAPRPAIILVHSQHGDGPKLHRPPYPEVFVGESGRATFQICEQRFEGGGRSGRRKPAGRSSRLHK